METSLFRKRNIERISSPDQLSEYLHVTTPVIWIVLASVALILASLFVWSSVTAIESYASGTAEVSGGVLSMSFDNAEKAKNVEAGMNIRVGDMVTPILSVGCDENERLIAVAASELPDGRYKASVGYKSTQIIDMLFN